MECFQWLLKRSQSNQKSEGIVILTHSKNFSERWWRQALKEIDEKQGRAAELEAV